jgi:ubiquinone/menaquinone biosynthesis C-methylase UbiE
VLNMGCHGDFALDESTRRKWYNSEQILQRLGLGSGMVFADIGCGDGFFSILAAKIVGENGKVYAMDTDSSAIQRLKNKAEAENLNNITALVGKAEDIIPCKGCADFVFYGMVLHDFYDPQKVLRNAREIIKPDGMLVDLDWKKSDMSFGPPASIRFSEEHASGLVQAAKFAVNRVVNAGAYHYLLTAKPA